jgi:hypothetical protein
MPAQVVFVSSTTVDLGEARQGVTDAIIRAKQAVSVMEKFGASALGADETSIRHVQECDIFVGLIGLRYGWVPPDYPPNPSLAPEERLSITELEYFEAQRLGKRVLMYVPADAFRAPRPPGDAQSFRFIERIQAEQHTAGTYATPADLPHIVVIDLLRLLQQLSSGGSDTRLPGNAIPPGINAIHNGIRHLENENYDAALYDLRWAAQLLPRDATPSFLIALALLRGQRPRIHTMDEVNAALESLKIANNIRPTRIALGLQAAIEDDYYNGNGFNHGDLIRSLEDRQRACRMEETDPRTTEQVREELFHLNQSNLTFVQRLQPALFRAHPYYFA